MGGNSMTRSLCVWLAVATIAASACDSDSSGTATGGSTGTGGSAGSAGGAGGTAGSGGSAGSTGGGGGGGAKLDGPSSPLDVASIDFPPPSDAMFDSAEVPAAIPLDQAPIVFADVICEKIFSCCTSEERGTSQFLTSQAGCATGLGLVLSQIVPQATTAMSRNRAMYDPAALATCLKTYQAEMCNQLRTDGGLSAYRSCKFIKPLVALGGACDQHLECINGYCLGGEPTKDGVCTAKKANGQMCFLDDECTSGRCNTSSATCAPATVDGLCTSLRL
jgi:hypothetical protein